jgi:ribosomal protein S18 acetylase RimI-like enzyme
LFRIARLRRILEIVRYGRGERETGWPAAELLSIAVAQDARGQGIADSLYARLIEAFRNAGVAEFRIVVGNALAPAHRFYRRMGAVEAGKIEVHAGDESTVYVQRVPR